MDAEDRLRGTARSPRARAPLRLGIGRRVAGLLGRRLALEDHLQLESLVVNAAQTLADRGRFGDRLGEGALEIAQDLAQAAFANTRLVHGKREVTRRSAVCQRRP